MIRSCLLSYPSFQPWNYDMLVILNLTFLYNFIKCNHYVYSYTDSSTLQKDPLLQRKPKGDCIDFQPMMKKLPIILYLFNLHSTFLTKVTRRSPPVSTYLKNSQIRYIVSLFFSRHFILQSSRTFFRVSFKHFSYHYEKQDWSTGTREDCTDSYPVHFISWDFFNFYENHRDNALL